MLHLASDTDPAWVARALAAMPEILLDHAHCEKKAASTAMSLIFKYPDYPAFMRPLSELAREELGHFELVLEALQARGIPFKRQRPSPYAGKLMQIVRQKEPHQLLDLLLCCSLIEARSCERMKLLAEALPLTPAVGGGAPDRALAAIYDGLLASEARHHVLFVDLALASGRFTKDEVEARLAEIAAHEAAVIADAPHEPRIHN